MFLIPSSGSNVSPWSITIGFGFGLYLLASVFSASLSVALSGSLGVALPGSLGVAVSASFKTRIGTVSSFVEPSGYSISILPLYLPGLSRFTPSFSYSVMSVTIVPSGSSSSRFTTLSVKSTSSPA